ncbi:Hypothetical predicted protein [Paramuricea clavata]|uniref:DUF7041 domain-containing protein n=1 Tax=Paramuricea clavata TaxID=317549 RepID=A0A6S7KU14_PARCT|nr:Hypothetical predicted protein [Paramuricea clavata]
MANKNDAEFNTEVINAVALKLPSFFTKRPAIWFAHAEGAFHLRNITDDCTKYHHIVQALPEEVSDEVADILEDPPEKGEMFQTLKSRLVEAFQLTSYQRAELLLSLPGLGDKRPSKLMTEMIMLLPKGEQPGSLFRQIFLRQLPEDIRTQLVGLDIADNRQLAIKADALMATRSHAVQAIEVDAIRRSSRTDKPRKDNKDGLCFYHRKFANDAKKCVLPCSFPGNALAGRN